MNLNVFCGESYTTLDVVLSALEFAILGADGEPNTGDEADVINMSLGESPVLILIPQVSTLI